MASARSLGSENRVRQHPAYRQARTQVQHITREVVFDETQATEAARLFNAVGRNRRLRVDAMIAGTATSLSARLATNNQVDFEPFLAHGLQLI